MRERNLVCLGCTEFEALTGHSDGEICWTFGVLRVAPTSHLLSINTEISPPLLNNMTLQNIWSMETKNYGDDFVSILLCDIHDTMKLFAFLLPAMRIIESSTVSLCFKTHFMVLCPRPQNCRETQMFRDMDMALWFPWRSPEYYTNSSGRCGDDPRWPEKNNKT